jgi:hypothetical protein
MATPWDKVLQCPHRGDHFVQLYQAEEATLNRSLGQYLWEGLRRGEGVLLIGTAEHRQTFLRGLESLGAEISSLLASRQLVLWDAQETLAEFMVAGQPDWPLFEKTIRAALRQVRPHEGKDELRAYGEMVGILWRARQFAAAIRLEQLWNRLLEQLPLSLYCAYAIDVFSDEFAVSNLDGLLCTHTHLVPAQPDGILETALDRSIDEILGPGAERLRVLMRSTSRYSWAVMPRAESILLWLRKNLPERAGAIVERAREHYRSLAAAAIGADGTNPG